MATNSTILRAASRLFAAREADYAAYLEECDAYAAQGYRPRTCFHGVNQWVDYDAICGECEDFGDFDRLHVRRMALASARRAFDRMTESMAWVAQGRKLGTLPHAAEMAAVDTIVSRWAADTLTRAL